MLLDRLCIVPILPAVNDGNVQAEQQVPEHFRHLTESEAAAGTALQQPPTWNTRKALNLS